MAQQPSERDAVVYIDDPALRAAVNSIPVVRNRATLVHELVKSYQLLELLQVYQPSPASEEQLKRFHSSDYVRYLKATPPTGENEATRTEEEQEDLYGLGFDCPVLPCLWTTVRLLAGGSLTGAKLLNTGSFKTVINWCGGWHHAQRDAASGFCYVNDIVLAILELRQRYRRVAYVDLDIHHGDGVQNAFSFSRSVLTVSIHLRETGFFPGTGDLTDVGEGEGKFCTLNIPCRTGLGDHNFLTLIKCMAEHTLRTYGPQCLVLQCGADALPLDRLGGANVSIEAYQQAVQVLLELRVPTLILGGGGYMHTNVARLWTSLTATALGKTLEQDIPEHKLYGPSFDLSVTSSNRKDENSQDYMCQLMIHIKNHSRELGKILGKSDCCTDQPRAAGCAAAEQPDVPLQPRAAARPTPCYSRVKHGSAGLPRKSHSKIVEQVYSKEKSSVASLVSNSSENYKARMSYDDVYSLDEL